MPAYRGAMQWGTTLDALAGYWLGFALPPVRAAVDGWSPEAPDAACPWCGESIGPGEVDDQGCAACRGQSLPFDGVVRLGTYDEPIRSWVTALKHLSWNEIGEFLGAAIGDLVRDRGVIDPDRTIVVPVPMPAMRRWRRGIDHAAVLARAAARRMGCPCSAGLLRRGAAPLQASQTAAARRRGARGIRPVRGAPQLTGIDILIVDDVRTTGTTLARTARRLRRLGPNRVAAAVVAVADPPDRRVAGFDRSTVA